jgi:hypothetical protein
VELLSELLPSAPLAVLGLLGEIPELLEPFLYLWGQPVPFKRSAHISASTSLDSVCIRWR